MNCREGRPLLPLFLDGELDARQMREVALHCTRCGDCESELRGMERLQDVLVARIRAEVAEIDSNRIWAAVAPRLDSVARPWYVRVRERWDDVGPRWQTWAPVSAAVAAAGLTAILLWGGQPRGTEPSPWASSGDNSAIVDSVQSNVESLALLREPETNTMVLWITDTGAVPEGALGDLP
jgi:anti-sigma factor RsiW